MVFLEAFVTSICIMPTLFLPRWIPVWATPDRVPNASQIWNTWTYTNESTEIANARDWNCQESVAVFREPTDEIRVIKFRESPKDYDIQLASTGFLSRISQIHHVRKWRNKRFTWLYPAFHQREPILCLEGNDGSTDIFVTVPRFRIHVHTG